MTGTPIERHVLAAERRLVEALLLEPLAIPPRLAHATGLWKDAPVTIVTRAYAGDAIGYLRVATVSGVQLAIGNVLALARPNRPLPVLGADLVWLGARRETMIAADLTSMREGDARDADHRASAAALPPVSSLPGGGELPAWCRAWFSPSALYTRVGPDRLSEALATFDAYVEAWLTLAAAAMPSPGSSDSIRARQHAYAEAHRVDDKGLGLLGTMFGKAWAEEYVRGVLFPVG